MSALPYIVRFTEWLEMEIAIDAATSEEDALDQARKLWEESSGIASMRDNGTECWEAEPEATGGAQ